MTEFENKKKRMKTIINYKKYKTKQNNKNYKKNERNKHEHCWSLKTNNVQWNENVRIQDHVRNKLIMTIQFKNWLKMKKNHNEKLWMQNQINSNRIMNRD